MACLLTRKYLGRISSITLRLPSMSSRTPTTAKYCSMFRFAWARALGFPTCRHARACPQKKVSCCSLNVVPALASGPKSHSGSPFKTQALIDLLNQDCNQDLVGLRKNKCKYCQKQLQWLAAVYSKYNLISSYYPSSQQEPWTNLRICFFKECNKFTLACQQIHIFKSWYFSLQHPRP